MACSSAPTLEPAGQAPAPAGDAGAAPLDSDSDSDSDDPTNQSPHSLGTIVLGESHASGGGGTTSPVVSVSFVPDALKARACTKKLDAACELTERLKCTKDTESFTGCGDAEACVLDDACAPKCKKIAVCSKDCEEDEICTLDKAGKASCAKPETFDAGPIAFSGTTAPITMYPPYTYEGDGKGAPFLAGTMIKVQAQGAVDAGFEKFDESFTSTRFIQTSPALNKIPLTAVFGSGSLPVAWKAGTDAILITIAGSGGSVTCKAKDADGKFDVPRAAIRAAIGDGASASNGSADISLSVSRQRKETKKGHKAKGKLTRATVQPEGWLDLVTLSTEATTFEGCAGGESICASGCTDRKQDPENCGACGKICTNLTFCGDGTCIESPCNSCIKASMAGECKAPVDTCNADAACNPLLKCLMACPSTNACFQACHAQYPNGRAKLELLQACWRTTCANTCN